MPIVTIELLEDTPVAAVDTATLQALGDDLGALFDSEPGGTWVRLEPVPRSAYVENGQALTAAVRPAFVRVLKADIGDETARASEAQHVSAIVAEHLGRPRENVHVLFEPAARGRIAFGGELLT